MVFGRKWILWWDHIVWIWILDLNLYLHSMIINGPVLRYVIPQFIGTGDMLVSSKRWYAIYNWTTLKDHFSVVFYEGWNKYDYFVKIVPAKSLSLFDETFLVSEGVSLNSFHYSSCPLKPYAVIDFSCHHWFRLWLGAFSATSHYLNQWWHNSQTY